MKATLLIITALLCQLMVACHNPNSSYSQKPQSIQLKTLTNSNTVPISKSLSFKLLSPSTLQANLNLNQQIQFLTSPKAPKLNLVLEVNTQTIQVIGLSSIGTRILSINFDGEKLKQEIAPIVKMFSKASIKGEYLIADLQIAYWPLESVKQNLMVNPTTSIKGSYSSPKIINAYNPEIEIREFPFEGGLKRVIKSNNQVILCITYSSENKETANLVIEHFLDQEQQSNNSKPISYAITNLN